ncbi:hypothetical protein T484DRAFT_2023757 [Baffinella frigidus]|nr:hypothetical protein T484DRAFT_2023757 [Cryptophyta sp. CCMP2293]
MNVRHRSSLRRASSDRRHSLTGISWNTDIEAVCIIPARAQDSFMALVQTPPPLRPSSLSPFDVTATAAGAAAASRAGVKLAMENSFKHRNRRASHDRQASALESADHSVAFEDDACSWLAKCDKPKRHTVMNSKWSRGPCCDGALGQ